MHRCRWILAVLTLLGLTACATWRSVDRVPLDVRLEGLYGHRLDIVRPPEPPRNPAWEHARLDITVRAGRYLDEHPELPQPLASALAHQELVAGLTMEQVRLLWGAPDTLHKIRRHTDVPSEEAIWSYRWPHGRPSKGCSLYFHDGVLERIAFPWWGAMPPLRRDSSGSRAQD